MTFSYIFEGAHHTDTSHQYMLNIGMTQDQMDSVLLQKEFELKQNAKRREKAYRDESDRLFFEWQYDGTAEKEKAWRDKVKEIKARFPLTEENA